jgi:hypothetical protein
MLVFEYYSLYVDDDLLLNYSMLFPRLENEILRTNFNCFYLLEIYSLVHNVFVDSEIVPHVSLNVVHHLFENYSRRKKKLPQRISFENQIPKMMMDEIDD